MLQFVHLKNKEKENIVEKILLKTPSDVGPKKVFGIKDHDLSFKSFSNSYNIPCMYFMTVSGILISYF